MALYRDTNPDLGISKATQHQHAAQSFKLAFSIPDSWAISARCCITHTRDGLLGLIAANQENKQRGTYRIHKINQQSKKRQLHNNTICSGHKPQWQVCFAENEEMKNMLESF